VVSTAEHEFFGIAVVEAMAAGAFPVLPDRLVYPERIPDSHHERCLYEDFDGLVKSVRWAVEHRTAAAAVGEDLAASVQRFDWTTVAPEYDKVLESLATRAD
jgi:glycosyltransferase involved in cell wall biosynthesis